MFSRVVLSIFLAIFASHAPLAAFASPPIKIRVKNPDRLGPDDVMLSAGWTLVLEFEASGAVGIVDDGFPPDEANQAWILSDPDGCIHMQNWISPGNPSVPLEGCAGLADETFVRFSIDHYDFVGLGDNQGINDLRLELQDDAFDSANLANLDRQYFNNGFVASTPSSFVGVRTEDVLGNPQDGFGLGTNDDFPGLYVWAEIGTNIVTDEFLNPVLDPITAAPKLRNMAGLVSSVTYTQASKNDRSSIVAMLPIVRGVLEPIVQVDFEIDTSTGLAINGFERRIDGGPVESFAFADPGLHGQTAAYEALFETLQPYEVVIKAVVVEGNADPFIQDLNGNGIFGRGDLILAGHTLLSNVARFRLRAIQFEALDTGFFECANARVFKDADLNGDNMGSFCSTGSARSIVRRPR